MRRISCINSALSDMASSHLHYVSLNHMRSFSNLANNAIERQKDLQAEIQDFARNKMVTSSGSPGGKAYKFAFLFTIFDRIDKNSVADPQTHRVIPQNHAPLYMSRSVGRRIDSTRTMNELGKSGNISRKR